LLAFTVFSQSPTNALLQEKLITSDTLLTDVQEQGNVSLCLLVGKLVQDRSAA
jgi:hypothetical protein